ncbi:MAG: FAD-binding oxidoreductase [Deltaproteobacteria bacterium]|nr:MAG: FAD-binding oxidoreductase [Deltaproteobacteria bacterium]
MSRLRASLGERVSTDAETLAAHRRDTWVLSELDDLEGRSGPPPVAVVAAASTEDVSTALGLCRAARIPVVPYGGGSGVCGGIRVPEGAVVVSTRGIAGLVDLDAACLTASFGAGTLGIDAEQRVQQEGLTIGQWPQSIDLSTVGGWVATRAAGQFSTGYGNIEDVVLALEVVLPDGTVLRTRRTPRASTGPDLRQLFMGSEGTLGVVTQVTFSLRPLPEARRGRAYHFAHFQDGIEPLRRLLRDGWRPPVLRLYDAAESGRHFPDACPADRAMLIVLHEGAEGLVELESNAVAEICHACGGADADASAVDHWLRDRNKVPGFRGFLEKGIILDTIEVAATWDRVAALYERVTASLREVPGMLLASSHSSHSYRSGTNLYFTFVARPDDRARMAETYRESWRRVMETTLAVGGGIAHHHGIGRVRRDVLMQELGEAGVGVLRALKRALDPDGLLNPGVLLPDPSDAPRS